MREETALLAADRVASDVQRCDAIVIGGNTAGLIVAYMLGQYGFETRLLEKSPVLGGTDRSFLNRNGRRFDFGLHVLDYMRSEFTTKLYERAVDGAVHKVPRRRGIVLRDHVIPYNAPAEEWPDELRRLLKPGPLVDELGTAPPTRENLTPFYGKAFVDFVFDEVLRSYPAECRHLEFGVEEAALMSGVYPWFFPRARRGRAELNESRAYQDRVRERNEEYLLYPDEGGFGAFAEGFRRKVEALGATVETDVADLELDVEPETKVVRSVLAHGQRWYAPRVYWCAPPEPLCRVLSMPAPDTRPDRFVLGSFELDTRVTCDHTELIVAAVEHLANRISFPGKFTGERDDLVQVEFAFPRGSELAERGEGFWMESWIESLKTLGIVPRGAQVVDFDLKSVPLLYNSYGVEGEPMPDVTFELPEGSNLRPVLPTIRNANINARVPQYLRFLADDLAHNA